MTEIPGAGVDNGAGAALPGTNSYSLDNRDELKFHQTPFPNLTDFAIDQQDPDLTANLFARAYVATGDDMDLLGLGSSFPVNFNISNGTPNELSPRGTVFRGPDSADNSFVTDDDWALYDDETRLLLEDYKCPICLDTLINAVKVDCTHGHKFCNFCIQSWIRHERQLNTECPVCRNGIHRTTCDIKTDAEISSAFDMLSERTKLIRTLAVKERVQLENRTSPDRHYHASPFFSMGYSQPTPSSFYPVSGGDYNDYRHYQMPQMHSASYRPTANCMGYTIDDHPQTPFICRLYNNTEPAEFNRTPRPPPPPLVTQQMPPQQRQPQSGHLPTSVYSSFWSTPTSSREPMSSSGLNPRRTNPPQPSETFGTTRDVRYQHYQHQNHNEQHTRWNNNLYLTPEDTSVSTSPFNSNARSFWPSSSYQAELIPEDPGPATAPNNATSRNGSIGHAHPAVTTSTCPVLSNGSFFSGGFPLYSPRGGYIGFHISHHSPPVPVIDRRVIRPPLPSGRITHPIVSLIPLNPDGSSTRVSLTFEVHQHRRV